LAKRKIENNYAKIFWEESSMGTVFFIILHKNGGYFIP